MSPCESWPPATTCPGLFFFFFFFFFTVLVTYGSSQARDGIQPTAATYATTVAMPDP